MTASRGGSCSWQGRPRGEVAITGEVPQAVGDEMALVELQALEHVRAARDHQPGVGVDRHVRERLGTTTVLAEEILFPAGHVIGTSALRTGMPIHHDNTSLPPPSPHHPPPPGPGPPNPP